MQSKRPRFNPLILALALAAVLMVWSVLGGTGSASSSSMEYSTVVHYFESLQVTQFSLDLNTGVITMDIKEGGKNNQPALARYHVPEHHAGHRRTAERYAVLLG